MILVEGSIMRNWINVWVYDFKALRGGIMAADVRYLAQTFWRAK